jgi:hypothetical protein
VALDWNLEFQKTEERRIEMNVLTTLIRWLAKRWQHTASIMVALMLGLLYIKVVQGAWRAPPVRMMGDQTAVQAEAGPSGVGAMTITIDHNDPSAPAAMLNLALPGNRRAIPLSDVRVDTAGNLTGSLAELTLAVAGMAARFNDLQVSNDGLSARGLELAPPPSWNSAAIRIDVDVRITPAGLQIGAASIPLPDIQIGHGAAFVTDLQAMLEPTAYGYRFAIRAGTLRVPALSSGGAAISGLVDESGQLYAAAPAVRARLAGADLILRNVIVTQDHLSGSEGMLQMPAALGARTSPRSGTCASTRTVCRSTATTGLPLPTPPCGSALIR